MCFHPLSAFLMTVNGKSRVLFKHPYPWFGEPLPAVHLPCGKCVGCRMDNARMWAIRCLHESQMHEDNAFVTLTFNDENLHDIRKDDVQKFFKRLRKALKGKRLSYYAVGEYGDLSHRPHYHALVFGWYPHDAYYWSGNGPTALFRSPFLERVWPYGNSLIGNVSYESACYCTRYCAKALASGGFALMSRRPALGRSWYDRYGSEVSVHDGCHVPNTDCFVRPPRYYDSLADPWDLDLRKERRRVAATARHAGETTDRLLQREESLVLRLKQKPRYGEFDAFD